MEEEAALQLRVRGRAVAQGRAGCSVLRDKAALVTTGDSGTSSRTSRPNPALWRSWAVGPGQERRGGGRPTLIRPSAAQRRPPGLDLSKSGVEEGRLASIQPNTLEGSADGFLLTVRAIRLEGTTACALISV